MRFGSQKQVYLQLHGGKLTGYRKMAETIVDRISKHLGDEKYGHVLRSI